jgi:hypothetical protein
MDTVMLTFRFLIDFALKSYRTFLMAATISTRDVGRGTSHDPMNYNFLLLFIRVIDGM